MFQVHTKDMTKDKEQHLTTASLLPLLALLLQAMAAKPLVTVLLPTVRVLVMEAVVAAVVVVAAATTVRVEEEEEVATTKEAAAVVVIATARVAAVVTIKEAMDMEV